MSGNEPPVVAHGTEPVVPVELATHPQPPPSDEPEPQPEPEPAPAKGKRE